MSADPSSSVLVVGGELPARLVVCIHCTRITTVPVDFPLILRRWTDLPLPDGWIWTQGELPIIGGAEPCMVPVCPTCAALFQNDRDAWERRRLESRDIQNPKGG